MTPTSMKQKSTKRHEALESTEPVGIVISRGRETELPPRFSAYMYAPAPDELADELLAAV